MDLFKASLAFLPSRLMIKVSSDGCHHAYTLDTSNVYGRALFWTVKDKQTEYVPKVNFQLEPKVRIKAKALIQPQWLTLTCQEFGEEDSFLPMMLTHQPTICGNLLPELLASPSSPRLHLQLGSFVNLVTAINTRLDDCWHWRNHFLS